MINNAYSTIFALNAMTQGKIWHVKPYSGRDSRDGKTADTAFKTLVQAQSKAVADRNDIVLLYAESNTAASTTDYQSSTLTWAKDGVHLIGVGSGVMIGQRSRVGFLSSYNTASNLFTLSADNCYVANIEFFAGVAGTSPTGCMLVTGQRNCVENCQISGIGATTNDISGAYSLKVGYPAAECIFKHCYIGLDSVIRATATSEIQITGTGTGTRVPRIIFEDCVINSYTSGSTFKALTVTYGDRFVILKNCIISAIQGITSAVAPTGAIATSDANGQIMLHGTSVYGYADVSTADNTSVYVASYPVTTVDTGVAGTVDISA